MASALEILVEIAQKTVDHLKALDDVLRAGGEMAAVTPDGIQTGPVGQSIIALEYADRQPAVAQAAAQQANATVAALRDTMSSLGSEPSEYDAGQSALKDASTSQGYANAAAANARSRAQEVEAIQASIYRDFEDVVGTTNNIGILDPPLSAAPVRPESSRP